MIITYSTECTNSQDAVCFYMSIYDNQIFDGHMNENDQTTNYHMEIGWMKGGQQTTFYSYEYCVQYINIPYCIPLWDTYNFRESVTQKLSILHTAPKKA